MREYNGNLNILLSAKEINFSELIEDSINNGFGKILFAKRYESGTEKKQLPIGHREGFYLVLKECDGEFLSFYGSFQKPQKNHFGEYFDVPSLGERKKDVYFSLHRVRFLRDYSIINECSELDLDNKERLIKKIKNLIGFEYRKERGLLDLASSPLQVGDVINYKDRFHLILNIIDDKVIGIPFSNFGDLRVDFNSRTYYFDLKAVRLLDNEDIFERKGKMDSATLKYVGELVKDQIDEIIYQVTPHIGSLIKISGKMYYIFDASENFLHGFRVIARTNSGDKKNIVVCKRRLVAKFEDKQVVAKDSTYEVRYSASAKEIEEIAKLRKELDKTYPCPVKVRRQSTEELVFLDNQDMKRKYSDQLGTIVQLKNEQKKYIVLLCDDDYLVLLDLDKYLNDEYYVISAMSKDVIDVATLSRKDFSDVLKSLQNKYSSYFSQEYINHLVKLYKCDI